MLPASLLSGLVGDRTEAAYWARYVRKVEALSRSGRVEATA